MMVSTSLLTIQVVLERLWSARPTTKEVGEFVVDAAEVAMYTLMAVAVVAAVVAVVVVYGTAGR